MTEKNNKENGAENINWDLSDLYKGFDDPDIKKDQQKIRDLTTAFDDKYRTMIISFTADDFLTALQDYEKINDLAGRLSSYAYLLWTTNTEDTAYGKLVQEINEFSSEIRQKLVFFDL